MDIKKWDKNSAIFEGHLNAVYKDLDQCQVYYIADKGYAVLNDQPKYSLYARLNIPEIQDIFVLPDARQQGIATHLIEYCESICTADMIGISVPVSPQFGPAQRLYNKLGYQPDGNGVTYDREPVVNDSTVKVDDQLCLMLIKDLNCS